MTFDFAGTADRILELQEKADAIHAKAKAQTAPMEAEIKDLEERLLLAMSEAQMKTFKGTKSVAEFKESLRISIKDFEAFATFLYRKKAAHLFERRISSTAYKEMKDLLGGKDIPGLGEYLQPKVNVKKAK